MSFNENNMINPGNYEEYFILYMDNELSPEEKLMVEAFAAQHPALAEELELLMSTKLPVDEISFTGKDELFSPAMKVATVDENLLLYIDDELAPADKKKVEAKIAVDKDYAQQHATLLHTKLNTSEKISHPNKKELYRRTARTVLFKPWMRLAAAVVVLLFGSLFFLADKNEQATTTPFLANNHPKQNTTPGVEDHSDALDKTIAATQSTLPKQDLVKAVIEQKGTIAPVVVPARNVMKEAVDSGGQETNAMAQNAVVRKREVVQFNVKQFTQPDIAIDAVKETLAHHAVTSQLTNRIIIEATPIEPAVPKGDFNETKRTSAKGLFRKVTRFIGRNTGIGTADIGEEVLIGAVALKLK
jgi:anti-sigma factor RsiW